MLNSKEYFQDFQGFIIKEIFFVFLKLGLSSFGGPIAHLGYFQKEFVEDRKWLDSSSYSDLVALCQFLPGPSSSQVGMAIGLMRAGVGGSFAAWLGFTLPSAITLVVAGLGIAHFDLYIKEGLLHGLKLVAAAVIAQAIWNMAQSHCREIKRILISLMSAITIVLVPTSLNQLAVIVISAILGILVLEVQVTNKELHIPISISKRTGISILSVFVSLLFILPLIAQQLNSYPVLLFANFFQTGSLVFGGGHVVLPLLQAQVVTSGWVTNDLFLAGYGITQAVPGPLFTFAAYLGAVSSQTPSGWLGASIALVAIFLPSFLMIIGVLPFWDDYRKNSTLKKGMTGVNAAVVGLLLAAFYDPVWRSTVSDFKDLAFVILFYLILQQGKLPPWLVVILGALIGYLIS